MEATTSQVSLASLQTALAGRYAFERELGRGGMATVFLARDIAHDRHVAVKVLLPELAVTLGVERFFREIEVGTLLQHPRIVGVLDSGQTDGILYYTMPYIEGQTLRDRLNREKQLPVEDVISIAQQVADALAYAHTKGVIHRDIKPENILLDQTGALVADFGIARAVSVAGGENLTRTGMAVGTPTYMSPEQAMGSKDVTPESDIYSLACVVYELLAGQPPFTGPTAMALLARHSLDNVPSLKIVRGTVPDAVEDAIVRAMAKVPADRFHSATDFSKALLDNEGAARRRRDSIAAKAIAAQTVEVATLGGKKSNKGLIIGVAAGVLALAGAGGWYALKGRTEATPAGLGGDFAKQNIAVMYFDDRSPNKDLGYLADGLTEALIDELSAVPQLKVTSRNGSAAFKGKFGAIPTDSIARALKIGTLVTGTVEPSGNGLVRVTVRLDDPIADRQIDKTTVEQQAGNTIALQDSIAEKVSLFLRERVGEQIQALTSKIGTRNAAAWDAMQRAKQTEAEFMTLRGTDVPAAIAKAHQADSALARVETMDADWRAPIVERAWLAYWAARVVNTGLPEYRQWIDNGLAHAGRALAKAPNDPGAIEARGTLHYLQWLTNLAPNADAAVQLINSAEADLDSAANSSAYPASAWNTLSHLLLNKAKLTDAKFAAENAYKADPFLTNVELTIHRLFLASLDMQLPDEAQKWCKTGRDRFPEHYRFTQCKLWLYALPVEKKPDMKEVWATYDEFVKVSPARIKEFDALKGKMMVGLAYLRAGMPDSAKAIAAASQGDTKIDPRRETVNLAAIIYAQAGDKDKALDLVKKLLAANPQQRAFAASDDAWWLQDLRSDPRYQALVKQN